MIRFGDYRIVLADACAELILTSPPYNIGSERERDSIAGRRWQTTEGADDPVYDAKSFAAVRSYPDALNETDYQASQVEFLTWAAAHLTRDGTLVYNHKPRRCAGRMIHPMEWILRQDKLVLMEEIIWDRCSTHNHSRGLMWPTTERLYVFRRADGAYSLDNFRSRNLPQRSDVWRIPFETQTEGHDATFPLALAEAAIEAWSQPGELVCDPYAGSGTTIVAAERLGRRAVGAELVKKHAELAADIIGANPSLFAIR